MLRISQLRILHRLSEKINQDSHLIDTVFGAMTLLAFTVKGIMNTHDLPQKCDKNPHALRDKFQRGWSENICAGLLNSNVVGLHITLLLLEDVGINMMEPQRYKK